MSSSTIDELKRLSAVHMDRCGEQLFMYVTNPTEKRDRYVFNNKTIERPAEALNYAMEMVRKAEEAPLPVHLDTDYFGGEAFLTTRTRKHRNTFSAALVCNGNVMEAMTTTTEQDAKAWAAQKRKEYGE